jgi:beta-lactamase superfamily II metal-dependent hydrolase
MGWVLRRDSKGGLVLEFVFWDVQHGSACYVKTPNFRHIVVDLGTGSYTANGPFSPLLHLKDKYGVKQLDYVIITHLHRDHIDDIFNFDAVSPKILYHPRHLTDDDILAGNKTQDLDKIREYLKISSRYIEPIQAGSASDPNSPAQWGEVRMSSFCSPACDTKNLNNHSIVTIFDYANSKILIPGDNETDSWRELIKNARFVQAAKNPDVLIAPHHGRMSAYCRELFDAIGKPFITIISDGPYCDTSATGCYGSQSKGWRVCYPDGTYEERLCVTTRKDGVIRVTAYYAPDGNAKLNVHVQKVTASG